MTKCLAISVALAAFACRHPDSVDASRGETAKQRASGPYEAYYGAGGPICGKDARSYEVECEPLDNCVSESKRRCEPSEESYQAYYGAGGAYCGKDRRGYEVECQPRHTCAAVEKSLCRPST